MSSQNETRNSYGMTEAGRRDPGPGALGLTTMTFNITWDQDGDPDGSTALYRVSLDEVRQCFPEAEWLVGLVAEDGFGGIEWVYDACRVSITPVGRD
jgi:hypothetical protein